MKHILEQIGVVTFLAGVIMVLVNRDLIQVMFKWSINLPLNFFEALCVLIGLILIVVSVFMKG